MTIMGLLQAMLGGGSPILFDHLAFRTFAVSDLGNASVDPCYANMLYGGELGCRQI